MAARDSSADSTPHQSSIIRRRRTPRARVSLLVGLVGLGALAAFALAGGDIDAAARADPGTLAAFAVLTLFLQAFPLQAFSSSISVSGIGMLAVGIGFGVGPAMATAVAAAAVHAIRRRQQLHKALFNASCFALATAAGTGLYRGLEGQRAGLGRELVLSTLAGLAFETVNVGLLALAIASAEGVSLRAAFERRLRWFTPHFLAFGPIALLAVYAEHHAGPPGLAALVVVPILLLLSLRASRNHTALSQPG